MIHLPRFITVLLAALLLAACGGQPAAEAPEPSEPTAAPAAEATEGTNEESEAVVETNEDMDQSAASAPAEDFPLTITDGAGRELTFEAPVERIVCLYNMCAEELAFIGVAPVAVGAPWTYNVALNPENFGEAAESFGQVPQEPVDWEAVASFEPDLIIGDEEMVDAAEVIAPLYALPLGTLEDDVETFTSNARNLGRVLGIEEEVNAKVQNALDRFAAYAELSPNDRTHLVVFFRDDTGSVIGIPGECGLFLSQLSPCASTSGELIREGSVETLLVLDPDVLIVEEFGVFGEDELVANLLENNPLWGELTAVQNDEFYVIPVSQARTNSMQSLQGTVDTLMPLIYPDIFDGPLTDEEVQEILASE